MTIKTGQTMMMTTTMTTKLRSLNQKVSQRHRQAVRQQVTSKSANNNDHNKRKYHREFLSTHFFIENFIFICFENLYKMNTDLKKATVTNLSE